MTDAQDAEQEPSPTPYVRLPLSLVALGIVVFLALLLGAGLYANTNMRQQGLVLPTPPQASPSLTPKSTPLPVALAGSISTTPSPDLPATSEPVAQPTPRIDATNAPALAPTSVSPAFPLTPTTIPITANATMESPTSTPTVEPTLAAEVGTAYEHYWQVRSEALLQLDKSHLSEAMGGDHLVSTSQLIDELLSENRAIQTSVDHDYQVIQATNESAQVFDDYLSSSFYVDPKTQAALTKPASDELRVLYQLKQSDGVWKVVDSVSAD
jgi:hypothetical protein